MNKQRKVLITTTYNEMGIIIDTKAEEVAQQNLQPTCNQLATDVISRQAVNDALDKTCDIVCQYSKKQRYAMCGACPLGSAYDVIENVPSADVQPVRHGHWIDFDDARISGKCSVCGWEAHLYEDDVVGMPHCPNCGARMDGEQE